MARISAFLLSALLGISPAMYAAHAAALSAHGDTPSTDSALVWQVKGVWFPEGTSRALDGGDAVPPGAVLSSTSPSAGNALLLLMPDGQRLYLTCAVAATCAQGFLIPTLQSAPSNASVTLLERARAVLRSFGPGPLTSDAPNAAKREVVLPIAADGEIPVGSLLHGMDPGNYQVIVTRISSFPESSQRVISWKANAHPTVSAALPGIYRLRIVDNRGALRIDACVYAAHQRNVRVLTGELEDAHARIQAWNEEYPGWPIHGMLRAYLLSLAADAGIHTSGTPAR